MAKSTTTASEDDLGPLMRALVIIEKLGNKLPHPFWLFLGLAVIVMFVSAICAAAGVSAVNPASGETVAVSNLFSTENLRAVVGGVVTNYVEFPALGLVLVVLFGVAVAERSGLFAVVMRGALRSASPRWVTAVVALVGTASSMASDASYMIVIPLGGMAFKAVGRNPVIGCAVAYAATAGGYSAAPFVNSLDAILGGLTTSAAHIVDDSYAVTPVANLYWNFVSMFVVTLAITLVTELVLNKRGDQIELDADEQDQDDEEFTRSATPQEKRGMWIALATLIGCFVLLTALAWPSGSFLRDAEGGFSTDSGLMAGIAAIVGFGFFLVGIAYGVAVGEIKKASEIPEMVADGVRPFVPVLVLFFAASQFLALFSESNLGQVIAIKGAEFFDSINASKFVILLGGFLLVAVGALIITSGSGLWTLLSSVLVPMFMLLGISPETTQAMYRVGDSTTNIVSPMSPYFVLILGFIQRYKSNAGIGTLLSLTIPLSITMWVFWGAAFFLWWALGIPWGPNAPIDYVP
ncbi:AbgT family transporter [Naumannella halotolerans]|uniref:Aminobenzoyl-glutamate transport protein n=1 Tax=Naumannella halotolerans TaxID=993414 RepID=A0A4R7JAF2_9ACTN|nr:AbgT family transporter [Naumannella halotolerans]TDT33607.1 aminobenzoyl-glutamate transport protein [Naumannella halotolerans]